jgi:cobalt-zinc-cadmium efflux system protein
MSDHMQADHPHNHVHEHTHGTSEGSTRRLTIVLVATAGYMLVETIAGWLTNSLALLADAGHMLTDAGAIALALFAAHISRLPRNHQKTFGYYRAEILAALANAVALILIVVGIAWEAYGRLLEPQQVMGREMMIVAAIGLVVNLFGAWILGGSDHRHSMNVRGVFLHIIGDALGSVAAIIAGLLMWWKGWMWADPATSGLIGLVILYGAIRLTGDSLHVLMEGTPARIDVTDLRVALENLDGVTDVHDLHVWSLSSSLESISVHLRTIDVGEVESILTRARDLLENEFGLKHSTIQVETPGFEETACSFDAEGAAE